MAGPGKPVAQVGGRGVMVGRLDSMVDDEGLARRRRGLLKEVEARLEGEVPGRVAAAVLPAEETPHPQDGTCDPSSSLQQAQALAFSVAAEPRQKRR